MVRVDAVDMVDLETRSGGRTRRAERGQVTAGGEQSGERAVRMGRFFSSAVSTAAVVVARRFIEKNFFLLFFFASSQTKRPSLVAPVTSIFPCWPQFFSLLSFLISSNMSGVQPVAVYALKVPPGGTLIPAVPDAAAMVCLLQ